MKRLAVAPLTDKEQHNNCASTGSGIISAEAKATANNTEDGPLHLQTVESIARLR